MYIATFPQILGNIKLYLISTSIFFLMLIVSINLSGRENSRAFPGAMGWGGETVGGRGGQIIKVTNLNKDGPGSLREAVDVRNATEPTIVVFEVGGVIDMEGDQLVIRRSNLTIAGQTAPSPGITIVDVNAVVPHGNNIIIQHLMIRPGVADRGWAPTGLYTSGGRAWNVIIDHCSITWSGDENLSASGPKFGGDWNENMTAEEKLAIWRANTSHRVTFSNNIISEACGAGNPYGESPGHKFGSLIHDNTRDIAVLRNLYSHNTSRNPAYKGGTSGVIANNLLYNTSSFHISYELHATPWGEVLDSEEWPVGELTVMGNYGQHGPQSNPTYHRGLMHEYGSADVRLYLYNNLNFDVEGNPYAELTGARTRPGEAILLDEKEMWHDSIELISAKDVPNYIFNNAGARPWDRDPIDERIIAEAMAGYNLDHANAGSIIVDENDVGGLPNYEPTYREFNPDEWDLKYMIPHAGYWEAPEPTSPENNAVDIGQSPTFQWNAEEHLTYFTHQLATDEEFSEIVVDETDITGSSYTINNLDGSTAYYWRVRGHNATGPSQWSEIRQFHTDNVPNAPVLLSPENGSASISDSALLEWETSDNAESHSVQVSVDSNFSTIVAEENDITQTNYELTNLETPATYHWRVRAHNSSGSSAWSDAWEFLLEPEPETGSLEIHLNSGWNQISSYIAPENPEIEQVFAGIAENLVLVKNDNSGVYWPDIEINEIGEWNPLHGYQVYVEDGDILEFTGTQLLPEQHPIDLQQGWNQVAYLRTTPMNVEEALAGIDNEIEIVSNNVGDVYWPEYDINSLVLMEPGQGYKISVTEDVTLTYPANDGGEPTQKIAETLVSQSASKHSNRPRHYNVAFGNTGDFAILLLLSPDLAEGDEVGVRSPSNELIGSGVAQNGKALVTVWGRNPVMNDGQNMHGAVNGDALRLTQWSLHEEREYPVTITQVRDRAHNQFTNALLRYQSEAVWIVDAEDLNDIPARYTLEQNYPNPFNPTTTIRYGIPEPVRVRLEVYNTIGQRIKVLVDEEKPAGYHQVIFDASDLSSGVYFYRLQAGNYTTMKRAVLIR